jgi:hypothetical protein
MCTVARRQAGKRAALASEVRLVGARRQAGKRAALASEVRLVGISQVDMPVPGPVATHIVRGCRFRRCAFV